MYMFVYHNWQAKSWILKLDWNGMEKCWDDIKQYNRAVNRRRAF